MAEQGQQGAHRIPENVDLSSLVEDAKKVFYEDPNVIGVGVGHRRRGAATLHDEMVLIVYVKTKVPEDDVVTDYRIPREFRGMATDVVVAFAPDSPKDALGFSESHQHSDDMTYVDWPRLHAQWTTPTPMTLGSS